MGRLMAGGGGVARSSESFCWLITIIVSDSYCIHVQWLLYSFGNLHLPDLFGSWKAF